LKRDGDVRSTEGRDDLELVRDQVGHAEQRQLRKASKVVGREIIDVCVLPGVVGGELGVMHLGDVMHGLLDAERDATLAYLDEVTRARGGRRGRARTTVTTGGLIFAHTRHATSRVGDPCPHDHVLVANLLQMGDRVGGWKAADTAMWRDELHAATMVGRLAAARRAVEWGLGIEADAGPSGSLRHWRMKGIPDEVLSCTPDDPKRSTCMSGRREAGTAFGLDRWRLGRPARPNTSSPRAGSWPAGGRSCTTPAGRRRCCATASTATGSQSRPAP
jgi:hypothetical protein